MIALFFARQGFVNDGTCTKAAMGDVAAACSSALNV
jgi:hypothetical protein